MNSQSIQKTAPQPGRTPGRAKRVRDWIMPRRGLILGFAFAVWAYLCVCAVLGFRLLEHSAYDSYTLQAMMWRDGRMSLDYDVPWLELAVYQGRYFVSFPPFPTVPMLLLSFLFGDNTPSRMVSLFMFAGSYLAGYRIARRRGMPDGQAAFAACFMVAGCNMMEFGLFGGVWNLAQTMGFLLTTLAFLGADSGRRSARAWGLVAIACAVGCRPFQAVYVPVLLWICYQKERGQASPGRAFVRMLPGLIAPLAIAGLYAAYNAARFGNPLEFGHSYLPEFTRSGEAQFSLSYVRANFMHILRLPFIRDGLLLFPMDSGFAFYLANPVFILLAAWAAHKIFRRRTLAGSDILLLVTLAAHFFILLTHKSFGGVQFGTRYLCDLVPAAYFLLVRDPKPVPKKLAVPVMAFGILFNIYGAIVFQAVYLGQWGL